MYQQQNPLTNNLNYVKNYFKKPIVLAIAIVSTISLILSYTAATETTGSAYILLALLSADSPSDLNDTLDTASDIQSLVVIISLIIPVLTTIAFYIIYFKSNSSDPSSNPSSGFSILSVISLIQLIFTWIIFVITGLLILIRTSQIQNINKRYLNNNSEITENIFVAIIVFVLIAWTVIGFYTSQYNFYQSAKTSLTSPVLSNKGAGSFGVYQTLLAVFYILAFIIALGAGSAANEALNVLTNGYAELDMLPMLLAFAVPVTMSIMLATLANGYRAHIQGAIYSQYATAPGAPQQPMYAPQYNEQPQYNPQQYNQQPQHYTQQNAPQPQYYEQQSTPQPQYKEQPVTQTYTPQPKTDNHTPVYDYSDDEKTLPVDDYKSYATPQTESAPTTCAVCGNTLISNASFCGHCGNKVK